MSDHSELKRLAKGATPGPWTYDNRDGQHIFGPSYRNGSTRFSHPVMAVRGARKPDVWFVAAANPKAVLGLINDNEKLDLELAEMKLQRDGLKIDNEALVKAIEHQCNWLQDMAAVGGKLDADNMKAMSEKLRHALAMNKVYARG